MSLQENSAVSPTVCAPRGSCRVGDSTVCITIHYTQSWITYTDRSPIFKSFQSKSCQNPNRRFVLCESLGGPNAWVNVTVGLRWVFLTVIGHVYIEASIGRRLKGRQKHKPEYYLVLTLIKTKFWDISSVTKGVWPILHVTCNKLWINIHIYFNDLT
jgi:hypothetical protein